MRKDLHKNMNNLKKLVILHSNDLHGDFTAEQVDEKLVGGVSRLSGYVNKVRSEEKNVIYAIAGDMFRGSLIDSDLFSVVLQNYHYLNMNTALDLSREEVEKNKKPVKIASDASNVLEEYFVAHPLIELDGVPRVVIHMD